MQNRLKSPVLWTSVISLIGLVLTKVFNIEVPWLDEVLTAVLSVMILLGIVNNPTNPDGP